MPSLRLALFLQPVDTMYTMWWIARLFPFWFPKYTVNCKNGPVTVHADDDEAILFHLAGWSSSLDLEPLDVELPANYADLIRNAIRHWTKKNDAAAGEFTRTYRKFRKDPCNKEEDLKHCVEDIGARWLNDYGDAIRRTYTFAKTQPDPDRFFSSSQVAALERLGPEAPLPQVVSHRLSAAQDQMKRNVQEVQQ